MARLKLGPESPSQISLRVKPRWRAAIGPQLLLNCAPPKTIRQCADEAVRIGQMMGATKTGADSYVSIDLPAPVTATNVSH